MKHYFVWIWMVAHVAFGVETTLPVEAELHTVEKVLSSGEQELKILRLKMRRFPNPDGTPVILNHAVVLTNLAMYTIGEFLWRHGFDVWMPNLRSHGFGDERSEVFPYAPGDYSFDKIVTEDCGSLLDYVMMKTGKKPHIIGYSMGGMSWEQYLGGVTVQNGKMLVSETKAASRSQRVLSFTALTVPPDFVAASKDVVGILQKLKPLLKNRHFFIPFAGRASPEDIGYHFGDRTKKFLISSLSKVFPSVIPSGIVNERNVDLKTNEFGKLAAHKLSSPHTDYVMDFLRWFDEGYYSRDRGVSYDKNKNIAVPILQITGGADKLAPPDQIFLRAKEFTKSRNLRVVNIPGFAHIDISFTSAIQWIGYTLVEFLKNPETFEMGVDPRV